jgi:hypothetical protein
MYVWSGSAWAEISSSADIIAYKYTVASGATSISGADDNSLTLSYTVGKEQVYINGVLQVRGSDYTASTGSSITGMAALTASDIVTVLAFTAFSVSNTYTQAEANARFVQNTGDFSAGKNKIINGDFSVWQRGSSFTSTATGFYYSADRFKHYAQSGTSNTTSRQTFTPGTAPVAGYEGTYFIRNTDTAGSATVGQAIENVNTFAGQTVTVSFWAKSASNQTGNFSNLLQLFGTGGSSSVYSTYVSGQYFDTTTSWQRFTALVTVPSIAGKTIGAGNQLYFEIVGKQNVALDVWGVQIEAGSIATAFQTATGNPQAELAACQRYYYRLTAAAAAVPMNIMVFPFSTTAANAPATMPVPMRTVPTSIDFSNLQVNRPGNAVSAITSLTLTASGVGNTILLSLGTASGLVSATAAYVDSVSSSGYFGLSAEL